MIRYNLRYRSSLRNERIIINNNHSRLFWVNISPMEVRPREGHEHIPLKRVGLQAVMSFFSWSREWAEVIRSSANKSHEAFRGVCLYGQSLIWRINWRGYENHFPRLLLFGHDKRKTACVIIISWKTLQEKECQVFFFSQGSYEQNRYQLQIIHFLLSKSLFITPNNCTFKACLIVRPHFFPRLVSPVLRD